MPFIQCDRTCKKVTDVLKLTETEYMTCTKVLTVIPANKKVFIFRHHNKCLHVYLYYCIATCFGLLRPSSGKTHEVTKIISILPVKIFTGVH
jgi:hypothetical protein